MESFVDTPDSIKVLFGNGVRHQLREVVKELSVKRVCIITTKGRKKEAKELSELLGDTFVGIHNDVIQHVPVQAVDDVTNFLNTRKADCIVTIGGGSTIGLAKAALLRIQLPFIAIPTTYSGSEMTSVWGMTSDEKKQTERNPAAKPQVVLYDPELTITIPPRLTLTSGINAMAHCVEALYSNHWNPINNLLAEEGIRAIFSGLQHVKENSGSIKARSEILYGSWLAGKVMEKSSFALHHKLCHALGGICGLPHSETHTVILPHVIDYNEHYAPMAIAAISRSLGEVLENNVASTLYSFIRSFDVPSTLSELGMDKKDIPIVIDQIMSQNIYNPRPVSEDELELLLHNAYEGKL